MQGSEQPLWARGQPSRVVAADESPELPGHSVNQFLLVSLILPKLCKHVVLAARVLHLLEQGQSRHRVYPEVLAVGLTIVSKVGGPIPLDEEIQELSQVDEGQLQRVLLEPRHRAGSGKLFTFSDIQVELL